MCSTLTDNFLNNIICGDILKVLRDMPDKAVDLVVTSPPYNLKQSIGNGMKNSRGGKLSNAALLCGYARNTTIACLMENT
jgi:modification methylase